MAATGFGLCTHRGLSIEWRCPARRCGGEVFLKIGVRKSSILVVHNFEQMVISLLKRTSDG